MFVTLRALLRHLTRSRLAADAPAWIDTTELHSGQSAVIVSTRRQEGDALAEILADENPPEFFVRSAPRANLRLSASTYMGLWQHLWAISCV